MAYGYNNPDPTTPKKKKKKKKKTIRNVIKKVKDIFTSKKNKKKAQLKAKPDNNKPQPKTIPDPAAKPNNNPKPQKGANVDVLGLGTKTKAGIDAYVARMMKSEGLTREEAIAKFKKSKGF